MESPPILEKKRYHDLDALRATAMLLGILLHGVISFMGEKYWPIQDTQSPYWEVPAEIHEVGSAIGMELPENLVHTNSSSCRPSTAFACRCSSW